MEAIASRFDNSAKQLLEELLGMSTGYVMDLTNGTFAEFVETSVGFNPYDRYDGSKAAILRRIWLSEPFADVSKLNRELLERWRINKARADERPSEFEAFALERLSALFGGDQPTTLSSDDLAFLDKDLTRVDLSALPPELTAQEIIEARLGEIDRALDADAPLAVIFLAGSTLEGLLSELARAHPSAFVKSPAAPRFKSDIKQLDTWTLADLINVSRVLGVLSEDVAKHANQVRNFRNYIHPRQQLKEGFVPRAETARIAQQVLRAALADLRALAERGGPWS